MQGDTGWTRQRVRIVASLMAQQGVSQSELARRLAAKGVSVSQMTISLILSGGIKHPRKPTLVQVARAIGVPLDVLRYAGGQASDVEAVIKALLALPERAAVFDEEAFDKRLDEARWRLALTPFIHSVPAPDGTMQPVKTTFAHALAMFTACDSQKACAGSIARDARSAADEIARAYAVLRFYDPEDAGINEDLQLLSVRDDREATSILGLIERSKAELRGIITTLQQIEN